MKLSRPELFKGHEWFFFLLFCSITFVYSLLVLHQNFTYLTQFDDTILEAEVLQQYEKTKKSRRYYVLKLRLDDGSTFYSTAPLKKGNLKAHRVRLWLLLKRLTFLEYLQGFYLPSNIISSTSNHDVLQNYVSHQHTSTLMKELYGALFFATTISKELRQSITHYGISHLLAISGFHLGVLSFILFLLLRKPMRMLYDVIAPFRHSERDLFVLIIGILFVYTSYIDFPASLMRALAMMIIGYFLYDRGFKIISMQTLFITAMVLIALFPKLLFSLGFFLSLSGVFYIFLFLHFYKESNKFVDLVMLSLWMYLMMLPISLYFFHTFSLVHPFSIIASIVFTLFYPLVLLLHSVGYGELFDGYILSLLEPQIASSVKISAYTFYLYLLISLLSVRFVYLRFVSVFFALGVFSMALSNVL